MRPFFSILLGIPLFIFLVLKPLMGMWLMVEATSSGNAKVAIYLLARAHQINPYNNKTLVLLGDLAHSEKEYKTALWAYAEAIKNSLAESSLRAKYAITLTNMGYDGSFAFKEAHALEPNHPYYPRYIKD